jgi:hypothetical protein
MGRQKSNIILCCAEKKTIKKGAQNNESASYKNKE